MTAAVAKHMKLTPVQTLFARHGSDPAHDAGLLVAEVGQDDDLATPELDASPVADLAAPGAPPARLAHFGDYSVVSWYRVTESTTLAISRGLSDAQLVAAARAAEFDQLPTITDSALPAGFESVATSPLLPRERGASEERIWLADAHRHLIRVSMSDLDEEARRVDRFLADYPSVDPGDHASERTIAGRTVFVRGDAPEAVVDALAGSIAAVSRPAWNEFERKVLDVPVSLLFSGCRTLNAIVVIDGVRGNVRWGVAIPTPRAAPPCSGAARYEVGDDANMSGGLEGPVQSYGGGPGSFGITVLVAENRSVGLSESSLTIGGSVPAETTRVVVGSGDQEIEAALGDAPDHTTGELRYYGAYLDLNSLRLDMRVTAYDADGRVVGRFVSPTF